MTNWAPNKPTTLVSGCLFQRKKKTIGSVLSQLIIGNGFNF